MRQSYPSTSQRLVAAFCLFTLVFFIACSVPIENPQDSVPVRLGDRAGFQLNGPVKSIRTQEFRVTEINGALNTQDTLRDSFVSFNELGLIESVVFYQPTGDTSRFERRYYDDGFLLKTVIENRLWDEIETTTYQQDTGALAAAYEVLIDRPQVNLRNALKATGRFEYDENDDLKKESMYNAEGTLTTATRIIRRENGHKINEKTNYSDGKPYLRIERERDAQDRFLRYSQFNASGEKIDETIYSWKNDQQWDYRISTDEDSWLKETFRYDEKGNIVSISEQDSLEVVLREITYKPTLDRYDNLIYEVKSIDGSPVSVLQKEIAYYTK